MPLRVALADDEPLARNRLARLLVEAGCDVLAAFEDGPSLLTWLETQPALDVLFLDILMPGPTGLEVMAELPPNLPVVFVTVHGDHAVAAFEHRALDYLVKPVTPERLAKTLARLEPGAAPRVTAQAPPARIPVKAGDGKLLLDMKAISHFEVIDQVVWALAGGKRFRTVWVSLAEVESALPGWNFMRVQRHVMLRPETVLGMRTLPNGKRMVTLPQGIEVEVSRSAAQDLRNRLGL